MDALIKTLLQYREARHLDERQSAVDAMARLLWPVLHRFLSMKCPKSVVDDLVQETLVDIIRGLPGFKGTVEFKHWCFRIAQRRLADHYQRGKRAPELMDHATLWKILEASGGTGRLTAEERVALNEALELVEEAREHCSDYLRAVYIYGWTRVALGELLKMTEDAVRMEVNRCLKLARSLVKEKVWPMSKQDAEAKLEQLNQRLEAGWNNLHSIKESRLEALRDVVREQWQAEQKQFAEQKQQGGKINQGKKKSASQELDKIKRLSQKKNQGHSQ